MKSEAAHGHAKKPCESYWKKRGCKLAEDCPFSHEHRPKTAQNRRDLKKRAKERTLLNK